MPVTRAFQPLLVATAISLLFGASAEGHGGAADAAVAPEPGEAATPGGPGTPEAAPPRPPNEFTFARAVYSDTRMGWGRGRPSWMTDYPKADQQFLVILRRLVDIDAFGSEFPVRLEDPDARRFPFLYAVEVGRMSLTDAEVEGLRSYLQAGGFLFVDDFWGTREWWQFEEQMRRVFPGRPIVELPLEHELFTTYYDIDEVVQVPNVWNGRSGGPTWERDGYDPHVRAILDDDGRIMVLINWNSDLGDAWEWAEDPYYPLRYSTYAIQLAANAIVYAMSH